MPTMFLVFIFIFTSCCRSASADAAQLLRQAVFARRDYYIGTFSGMQDEICLYKAQNAGYNRKNSKIPHRSGGQHDILGEKYELVRGTYHKSLCLDGAFLLVHSPADQGADQPGDPEKDRLGAAHR
jgi:hypothetical protein